MTYKKLGSSPVSTEIEDVVEEEDLPFDYCTICGDPLLPGEDHVDSAHYWCYAHRNDGVETSNPEEYQDFKASYQKKGPPPPRQRVRKEGKLPPPPISEEPWQEGEIPQFSGHRVGNRGRAPKYNYPPGLTANERRNFRRRADRIYTQIYGVRPTMQDVIEARLPSIPSPVREKLKPEGMMLDIISTLKEVLEHAAKLTEQIERAYFPETGESGELPEEEEAGEME